MSKRRYEGLQNDLMAFIPESCFFLTLLSIAEDRLSDRGESPENARIDFVGAYQEATAHGWLRKNDNMMMNDVALLQCLTGDRVTKRVAEPTEVLSVAENEYTAAKWRLGSKTHFRRRLYDVYADSITVKRGTLEAVYVYKFEKIIT